MSSTNSFFALALGAVASLAALPVRAFVVNPGDVLTLATGTGSYDANGELVSVTGGSWFALDANSDFVLAAHEKTLLSQGTTGLVIGAATLPGASHAGLPLVPPTAMPSLLPGRISATPARISPWSASPAAPRPVSI